MRIAEIAPLYESVPPRLYGGTERVVSWLTDELVRQGHDVTLFASGDSVTRAELAPCCERALRLDGAERQTLVHHVLQLERVMERADDFDVLHFHTDFLHFPLSRRQRVPALTTLHGRLDLPELVPLYRGFPETPVASISDAQRRPLPWLHWLGTVNHGLPRELFPFRAGPGEYLAFLGRISPEKRPDRAIAIARRMGLPLRIAAKVDNADREYFASVIRPLLDDELIEYVGEISQDEKADFLGRALALLFPIDWPEPFGLAMIEAMACGTPVLAWRNGSTPEVVDEGVTGWLVEDMDGAVAALGHVAALDRAACRARFELRFPVERMTRDYLALFARLIDGPPPRRGHAGAHVERSASAEGA